MPSSEFPDSAFLSPQSFCPVVKVSPGLSDRVSEWEISRWCPLPEKEPLCHTTPVFGCTVGLVPPRYSLIVSLSLAVSFNLGLSLLPSATPSVWAAAAQIQSIALSCAAVGQSTIISGHGFGATHLQIMVDGVPAAVTAATGNRATFVVPAGVAPGVVVVTATNPGGHSGSIALRVKGPEICGANNTVDEDCDGQINDAEDCPSVNYPPVAHAEPDQTQPVGTTVQLDGTASTDPDGDALTFTWRLATTPSGSIVTLTGATTATPTFVIDKAGTYTVHLTVSDGTLSSSVAIVIISTANSAPVAAAGDDRSGQVGNTLTLDGSGSTDVDDVHGCLRSHAVSLSLDFGHTE
jgi:hypothetical protein